MTIPDSPALDLDALAALEQAASPAPWTVEHEGGYIVHGLDGTIAEACSDIDSADDAALIAAARNALPALLSALAAARAERDEALARNIRLDGRVTTWKTRLVEETAALREELAAAREQIRWAAEQIPLAQAEGAEEARKRELAEQERDAAREQAKQAQAELAAVRRQAFWLLGFYHIDHCESRDDAAAVSACPDSRCAEAARALNLLPAAAPDPATVLRSGPCATANCAFCTRDDCGCSCHDVTHAEPVPAGGEDGSGTADGHRQDAGHA